MIRRLFIEEAEISALKSDMNFNHGAVLIYRGKILSKGYNYYHEPKYNSNYKESVHAEVSAINNALKKVHISELKKCELVIIRINRHGDHLNSKPCCHCQNFINKFNIKKVFHS
jgi:cytidine deaminase